MNLIVPALSPDCAAVLALRAEGLDPIVRVMEQGTDYGAFVQEFWRAGDSLMVVEHDIAPWPGAVAKIEDCPLPWCGYRYPLSGGIGGSLGCVRFSRELTSQHHSLADDWHTIDWRVLDGYIETAVRAAVGYPRFHPHEPAVAHVRRIPT